MDIGMILVALVAVALVIGGIAYLTGLFRGRKEGEKRALGKPTRETPQFEYLEVWFLAGRWAGHVMLVKCTFNTLTGHWHAEEKPILCEGNGKTDLMEVGRKYQRKTHGWEQIFS